MEEKVNKQKTDKETYYFSKRGGENMADFAKNVAESTGKTPEFVSYTLIESNRIAKETLHELVQVMIRMNRKYYDIRNPQLFIAATQAEPSIALTFLMGVLRHMLDWDKSISDKMKTKNSTRQVITELREAINKELDDLLKESESDELQGNISGQKN